MGNQLSGHNSTLLIELNDGAGAVASPGTFVQISKVTASFTHSQKRATKKVTPKGDTVPEYVISPEIDFDTILIKGGLQILDDTHNEDDGLQAHFEHQTKFGLMLKGPSWVAGVDEIIHTGELISFKRVYGNEADEYGFEAEFQSSGIFKREGDLIGTVYAGQVT